MTSTDRAVRDTFVQLADTLVDEFDVIDFLDMLSHRTVELLQISACGVMVADHNDGLNVVAASSERTRSLELYQLQNVEGPCQECYQTGERVRSDDLADDDLRWPKFAPIARAAGFTAVEAVPMRLRDEVIGAMNLFSVTAQELDQQTVDLGQALADMATIGILHERVVRERQMLAEQLQTALDSRIVIEQAKGVIAERTGVSVQQAFGELRSYARRNNRKLADVAAAVIEGDVVIGGD